MPASPIEHSAGGGQGQPNRFTAWGIADNRVIIVPEVQVVIVDTEVVHFRPKEVGMLAVLASHVDTTVAPPELYRLAWGAQDSTDYTDYAYNTLKVHMSHIRQQLASVDEVLGDWEEGAIQTDWNEGWRAVSTLEAAA